MNRFHLKLGKSNENLKAERISYLEQTSNNAMRKVLMEKEDELNKLLLELNELNDLGPDNALDLKPISSGFNADEWARKNVELEDKIYIAKIKYENARRTYNKWFQPFPEQEKRTRKNPPPPPPEKTQTKTEMKVVKKGLDDEPEGEPSAKDK